MKQAVDSISKLQLETNQVFLTSSPMPCWVCGSSGNTPLLGGAQWVPAAWGLLGALCTGFVTFVVYLRADTLESDYWLHLYAKMTRDIK